MAQAIHLAHRPGQSIKDRWSRLLERIRKTIVMDAPDWWDMHPDVYRAKVQRSVIRRHLI
jgi:hypothetical protein